jgi:hypothetical protein
MAIRIIIPLLILTTLLSACEKKNPITPTQPPTSGISGQVMIGPVCPGPVAIGDTLCADQPYQATLTILDSENKEISKIQPDNTGHFSITLPPGIYTIHPISGEHFPRASVQGITVYPDQYSKVTILYDTGMR